MPESTIRIKTTGMHCGSCSMLIKMSLEDVPGVSAASADHATGITEVTYDTDKTDAGQLVDTIVQAGYGAELMS